MYTSPTVYQGVAAVRIAISNWGTGLLLDGGVEDDDYQGDGNLDAEELKKMPNYEQGDGIWDAQELKGMTGLRDCLRDNEGGHVRSTGVRSKFRVDYGSGKLSRPLVNNDRSGSPRNL